MKKETKKSLIWTIVLSILLALNIIYFIWG